MAGTPQPFLLIVDPDGERPADLCAGPTPAGECPRASAGELVPCAGMDLLPVNGDLRNAQRRHVGAGEDECPLRYMLAGLG